MVPTTSRAPLHSAEPPQQQTPQHHGHASGGIHTDGSHQLQQSQQGRSHQQQLRHTNVNSPLVNQASLISKQQRAPGLSRGGSQSLGSEGSIQGIHTPLFHRLVSDDVQELKSYTRIIESQNRRLLELELVHGDLEERLEMLSTNKMDVELTLQLREQKWAEQIAELEKDREHWKVVVEAERTKNARLMDQVFRKDQDIHRMLQRKFDSKRENHSNSIRNARQLGNPIERTGSSTSGGKITSNNGEQRIQHKSPHEILQASGSVEAVRERNVSNALLDFFGM